MAEGLGLAYRLMHDQAGTIKEFALRSVTRNVSYEKLWALRDVSFSVEKGEVLAIIGPNGAGKSTMLKVVTRVLPPSEGRVIVRGRVAPIIELGAGFNPELTAEQNIVLYGAFLGRDPSYMRARISRILEWAGLEDFGDVPVRSLSSGMTARLAFSVSTDMEPDLLVVDEVLAVGDQEFRAKSEERMRSLINGGAAVILVSHALPLVLRFATRVVWLDHGTIRMSGDPKEVVEAYKSQ